MIHPSSFISHLPSLLFFMTASVEIRWYFAAVINFFMTASVEIRWYFAAVINHDNQTKDYAFS